MSENDTSHFQPTDPTYVIPATIASALEKPIRAADKLARRKGPAGIVGSMLASLLRAIVGGVEFWIAIVVCAAVVPVLRFYWESNPAGVGEKILIALGCTISIFWTWAVSLRSKDRDALRKMMLDLGSLLRGKRITKDAASYRYLVESYQTGRSAASKPTDTIRAAADCLDESTSRIREYYRSRHTASDWLCVIFANPTAELMGEGQFGAWLEYFHGFDRRMQPTDRIIRVFSTPVCFPVSPKGPRWGQESLDKEQRFRLLAYLFINRAVGVETKLHCFDPSQDDNADFFHEADYILVHDPAQERDQEDETLFIAIPGNERKCLRLCGRTIWSEAFEFEFYNRLTKGHGIRECDCIKDATTEQATELASTLGLADLKARWREVSNAMLAHNPSFCTAELSRMQRRWEEWFPM